MTAQIEPTTYVFGMRDRGGLLLGFRASQLALLGVGAALTLMGFLSAGGRGGMIGAAVAGAAACVALFPVQGRCLVDWTGPLLGYGYQRITGQGRYLGGPTALRRAHHLPQLD